MPALFDKVMRAGEGKILRALKAVADQVNSVEADFKAMSDAELRAQTDEYKERYAAGESLEACVVARCGHLRSSIGSAAGILSARHNIGRGR